MRPLISALLRFLLRIFFRRIEIEGASRVPAAGPVIFCPNHPNALVDPVLLLGTAPRPVSFLAKAPLFRVPVIGWFAGALDAIPVYRQQDGQVDPARTAEMFRASRALLERGGTIAIFPEGVSHNDPTLRPLKTGAARIALGSETTEPIRIVPVALTYTAKSKFRSTALVSFGEPIAVVPPPAERHRLDPDAIRGLTDQIADGMRAVMVHADHHEALALAGAVERLFLPEEEASDGAPNLVEGADIRRRLLAAYPVVAAQAPAHVAALRARLERHERRLEAAGLDLTMLNQRPFTLTGVLRYALRAALTLVLALPLALPGMLLHWPAYRLIDALARRYSRTNDDVLATAKLVAALLFFPLTWLIVGSSVGVRFGWPIGMAATLLAPVTGWVALRFIERFDAVFGAMRSLSLWLIGRERFLRLLVERRRLRAEVVALGETVTEQ